MKRILFTIAVFWSGLSTIAEECNNFSYEKRVFPAEIRIYENKCIIVPVPEKINIIVYFDNKDNRTMRRITELASDLLVKKMAWVKIIIVAKDFSELNISQFLNYTNIIIALDQKTIEQLVFHSGCFHCGTMIIIAQERLRYCSAHWTKEFVIDWLKNH